MIPDEQIIDFEDVKVQEATTYKDGNDMYLKVIGVDLGELLDAIGEKTVKEYYGIEDEE